MITRLSLHNFKCFQVIDLELSSLNLLSGLNGMGKSSVLQSLLLLRQSHKHREDIRLNSDLVELGYPQDVFYENNTDDIMQLELKVANHSHLKWEYDFDASKDTFKRRSTPQSSVLENLALFNEKFHYISADRWGPRVSAPLADHEIRYGNLGKNSEYTIHYLVELGDKPLPNPDIPHKDSSKSDLLTQVTAWLNEICPGTRLDVEAIKEADIGKAAFSFKVDYGITRDFRPTNVGFGLSYTLPVIVALLSLPKGGLVLLENPEAHLHPRGQTMMGKLMAQVAAAGVQVIVETHSDHVLDGIRVAVRDPDYLLQPEQTRFHYFERENDQIKVTTPKIDKEGRLDNWPAGFFDESIHNLAALSSSSQRKRIKAKEII
jgi:predicted ATPase